MVLATTLTGYYMASSGLLGFKTLTLTLLGSAFVGGGANALNQYLERGLDAMMKRTQGRPLPSKGLGKREALWFGILLSAAGLVVLFFGVNCLAGLIGVLALLAYVLLYTPLKQKTPANTLIGALSGAAPCLIGWTAANGRLGRGSFILFLILFVWQLPHFFAIAWVYREDYKNGGFKMLSVRDDEGKKTATQIVSCSVILFLVSLLPTMAGLAGLTYLFMAIFFGVFLVGFSIYLAVNKLSEIKKFVPTSIVYLFVLNLSMVLDKT